MMTGDLKVVLVSLTVAGVWGFGWLDFGVGGVDACCGACATLGFSALLNTTLGFLALLLSGRLVSGFCCTVSTGCYLVAPLVDALSFCCLGTM